MLVVVINILWTILSLAEFQLSLRRPPGTSINTRESWDGFAFSARFCLILAVSVSKNRDPRLQLKLRMEWGFAAYVLHTHCIPGRRTAAYCAGILAFFSSLWLLYAARTKRSTTEIDLLIPRIRLLHNAKPPCPIYCSKAAFFMAPEIHGKNVF